MTGPGPTRRGGGEPPWLPTLTNIQRATGCGCFVARAERIIVPVCSVGRQLFHESAAYGFSRDPVRFQAMLDHFGVTREQV